MKRRRWTQADDDLLRREYPNTRAEPVARRLGRTVEAVYRRARQLGVKKDEAFYQSAASGRLLPGHKLGRNHRFRQGQRPWNAGMKGWQSGGRTAETWFKPGHRPPSCAPVGTERMGSNGYRERKVGDVPGAGRRNWALVHVLLWEKHHGPVPEGHVVIFRNGNPEDIRLENLERISRDELIRRNSIHNYPPELADAMRTAGRLRKTIREKSREEQD